MADNVNVNGANIATDDIGGAQFQRVKIVKGNDGVNDGDVSDANPMPVLAVGELIEALEAQRMSLQALSKTLGLSMPDASGRLRVAVDAISATLANVTTVATVTTVTTVATLTNQANVGGFAANHQIPALTLIAAESLRRNIEVT